MRSQQRQGDDDIDMEAALGPQHGKFEAKAPEIEELKLRVEALQAQVPFNAALSSLFATAKSDIFQIALSELRLVSVMDQLFQVGEFLRGSKVMPKASLMHSCNLIFRAIADRSNGRNFNNEAAVFSRHEHHRLMRICRLRLHELSHRRDGRHSATRRDAAYNEVKLVENSHQIGPFIQE